MRNSTKTELRTLREIAHFLLPLLRCEFCGKPLLDPKLADKIFGDKAHTPLKNLKLTVHHRNGKHRDNSRWKVLELPYYRDGDDWKKLSQFAISGNTSLVHRPCHGEHEMKANHHKRKVMKVKPLRERAKELIKKHLSNEKAGMIMTGAECSFVVHLKERLKDKSKTATRYEIRRLKRLAAKVEKK